jgi:hypothetical protein
MSYTDVNYHFRSSSPPIPTHRGQQSPENISNLVTELPVRSQPMSLSDKSLGSERNGNKETEYDKKTMRNSRSRSSRKKEDTEAVLQQLSAIKLVSDIDLIFEI